MGIRGQMASAAVAELWDEELLERECAPQSLAPFYAAALLKVAREMRRSEPQRTIDEVLEVALKGTPVDRRDFRGYLERNFALVRGSGRQ